MQYQTISNLAILQIHLIQCKYTHVFCHYPNHQGLCLFESIDAMFPLYPPSAFIYTIPNHNLP